MIIPNQKTTNDIMELSVIGYDPNVAYLEWSPILSQYSDLTALELESITSKFEELPLSLNSEQKQLVVDAAIKVAIQTKQSMFRTLVQLQINLTDAVHMIHSTKQNPQSVMTNDHNGIQTSLDSIISMLKSRNDDHVIQNGHDDEDSDVLLELLGIEQIKSTLDNIYHMLESRDNDNDDMATIINTTITTTMNSVLQQSPEDKQCNEEDLVAKLTTDNAQLIETVNNVSLSNSKFMEQIDLLTNECNALTEQLTSEKGKVSQLITDKNPEQKQLDKSQCKIDSLKLTIVDLKKQTKGFEDRMGTLIKQNGDQQQRLEESQERLMQTVDAKYQAEIARDKLLAKIEKKATSAHRKLDTEIKNPDLLDKPDLVDKPVNNEE